MACAIETLVDLDTLSIEDLIGQLKATEERYDLDRPACVSSNSGKLLLSEEEWFARMTLCNGDGSSSSGGRGKTAQSLAAVGVEKSPPVRKAEATALKSANEKTHDTCVSHACAMPARPESESPRWQSRAQRCIHSSTPRNSGPVTTWVTMPSLRRSWFVTQNLISQTSFA